MRTFIKQHGILLSVFVTGAFVLMVEVIAVRLLSPYFGNTIYTVTSVIGVILAALSCGYAYGGRLIDRYAEDRVFFAVIVFGGLSVVFLGLVSHYLLPLFARFFTLMTGPLAASFVLFFLPGFLLGALSPMAVALQKRRVDVDGVGSIAGSVFFWSTLGSIVGCLATGFILIPFVGVQRIVLMGGTALVLCGSIPLIWDRTRWSRRLGLIGAACLLVFAGIMLLDDPLSPSPVIYRHDGQYEQISIIDANDRVGRSVRILMQDLTYSGARYLDSDDFVFPYTAYAGFYRLAYPRMDRALVIGGGTYTIPAFLLRTDDAIAIDVAEIEPGLFALAQTYFGLPDDPRLTNYVTDGRRFLAERAELYDFIFSDAYATYYSVPAHLATQEFFDLARSRLTPHGVFVANFIGRLHEPGASFLLSEMKTFQSVFPYSYFFATRGAVFPDAQNIIFVGSLKDISDDLASIDIDAGEYYAISFEDTVVDVANFDFDPYVILTDDFAPVEYLVGKSLEA